LHSPHFVRVGFGRRLGCRHLSDSSPGPESLRPGGSAAVAPSPTRSRYRYLHRPTGRCHGGNGSSTGKALGPRGLAARPHPPFFNSQLSSFGGGGDTSGQQQCASILNGTAVAATVFGTRCQHSEVTVEQSPNTRLRPVTATSTHDPNSSRQRRPARAYGITGPAGTVVTTGRQTDRADGTGSLSLR